MRIAVAGASGVVGRLLIPQLVRAGHDVYGFIRKPEQEGMVAAWGARPLRADMYDRAALFAALDKARPEAVIHQLTALGDRNFAENARIRREGTRNLVDASLAAGARRMIAQSISWAYAPGQGPAAEEEPLDTVAPEPRGTTVRAVQALESAVAEMPEWVVLRYGLLYGPGTWYAADGYMAAQARRGKLAATDGTASFVHVEDAARAAALALGWPSGAVNVVDHEPAAGTEWLPVFAAAAGAPPPAAEPGSARGERGALNARALALGWQPLRATWRDGFREASAAP